jgi:hypothetical protein
MSLSKSKCWYSNNFFDEYGLLIEMRTTEYNRILYFNDNACQGQIGFYMKRKEDRHTERQRVRERVSASVGQRRGKRRSTFTNNVGSNTLTSDIYYSASLIN